MIESVRTPEPRVQGQGICLLRHDQQPRTICDFGMTPVTSSSLVPTSTSNESDTRSVELRARSRYAVQRVSHSFRRASRSFQIHHPRVSHSCRRASRSFQVRNSRSRSTEDKQPPCSASTTTRNRGKEFNSAPLPCLQCFCTVSCVQGMTFCSTLKGCASHRCHCAKSNVQCTSMAGGWSGTNTPPNEGSQIYIHVPTQYTLHSS